MLNLTAIAKATAPREPTGGNREADRPASLFHVVGQDAQPAYAKALDRAAFCVRWTSDPGTVEAIPDAARLVPLPSPPELFKNLWDEICIFSDYTQAHLVLDGDRLGLAASQACDAASHDLCAQWLRDCEADARAYVGEHDGAPRPQGEETPGRKPCDRNPGLPCLGAQGTCLARPYWGLKTFDERNARRKAAGMVECPSADRVELYISELSQRR